MTQIASDQQLLRVSGMHCGSCAIALERLLQKHYPAAEIHVSFATEIVSITWPELPQFIPPVFSHLQQIANKLGYSLQENLYTPDKQKEAKQRQKHLLIKLAVAGVFGMWCMMPAFLIYLAPLGIVDDWVLYPLAIASFVLSLPVILFSGSHFYRIGWRTLKAGMPGLDSLIMIAVWAATALSAYQLYLGSPHVYVDAAAMLITFQLVARMLELKIRQGAAIALQDFFQDMPDQVYRLNEQGEPETISASEVVLDDCLALGVEQLIAVDGVITQGAVYVDTSSMTGEHNAVLMQAGDTLIAGYQILQGECLLRVTAPIGKRRLDYLIYSMNKLLSEKSAFQQLTDTVARYLLPTIFVAAALAFSFTWFRQLDFILAAQHALAVLIITCPCALSLAIPLVTSRSYTVLLRRGILLREPAALEKAAHIQQVIFDKTGTLTQDTPLVQRVVVHSDSSQHLNAHSEEQLLSLAQWCLQHSQHPTAKAIRHYRNKSLSELPINLQELGFQDLGVQDLKLDSDEHWFHEYIGKGTVYAPKSYSPEPTDIETESPKLYAGRLSWLQEQGIVVPELEDTGMQLHLAYSQADQKTYLGHIQFSEQLHDTAQQILDTLSTQGHALYLLSGDSQQACATVGGQLGIHSRNLFAECSPEQKHYILQSLGKDAPLAYIGDGLNDGLALVSAHLGIAVGKANASSHLAAAVYLPDGIGEVPFILTHAKQAHKLMQQNLAWALGYNLLMIPLALFGFIQPVFAAIAMTLSSLCVLLNSSRLRT